MFLKLVAVLALSATGITSLSIEIKPYLEDECGFMSSFTGLIQGGNFSKQSQFPWMAIISIWNNTKWEQNGSGSVISRQHVLAKSRYVSTFDDHNRYIPRDLGDIQVQLGTTIYNDLSQRNAVKMGITGIKLYPNSRKIVTGLSLFNFAILTMESDVTFSEFIRPICLWSIELNAQTYAGQKMMAVGYGRDESGFISNTRKHVAVQVIQNEECLEEYTEELSKIKESRFFCIKEVREGHGPCKLDTQLYIKIGSLWYLRGEMISSRIDPDSKFCLNSFPVIVEDITPYVDWINQEVNKELVQINGYEGDWVDIDTNE